MRRGSGNVGLAKKGTLCSCFACFGQLRIWTTLLELRESIVSLRKTHWSTVTGDHGLSWRVGVGRRVGCLGGDLETKKPATTQ